jgi:hypothetical protein
MTYHRGHAWGNFVVDGVLALFVVLASLAFGSWQLCAWFVLAAAVTVALVTGVYMGWLDLTRDPDLHRGASSPVPIWRLLRDLVPLALTGAYFVGTLKAAEYGWALLCGILLSASILTLLAGIASRTAERIAS